MAARKHRPLPLLADFESGDIASELPDMIGYDNVGDGEEARFIIKQKGVKAHRHLRQPRR